MSVIVTSDHLNKTLWAQLNCLGTVTILKIALIVSSKIRRYYGSTANDQCSNFNITTSHSNMNIIVPKFDTRLNRCMIIVRRTESFIDKKKSYVNDLGPSHFMMPELYSDFMSKQ